MWNKHGYRKLSLTGQEISGSPFFAMGFRRYDTHGEQVYRARNRIMNIYVGNLPYKASEDELRNMFESFGDVNSVRIITDHESGRSKGFAFVEMDNDDQAKAAIEELNGVDFGGRPLTVNEARPKQERPRQGGGGRGGFNNNRY